MRIALRDRWASVLGLMALTLQLAVSSMHHHTHAPAENFAAQAAMPACEQAESQPCDPANTGDDDEAECSICSWLASTRVADLPAAQILEVKISSTALRFTPLRREPRSSPFVPGFRARGPPPFTSASASA